MSSPAARLHPRGEGLCRASHPVRRCLSATLQHIEAAPWLCGVQLHALHAVGALRKHFLQAREQSRAGPGKRGTAVGCGGRAGVPRRGYRPSLLLPRLAGWRPPLPLTHTHLDVQPQRLQAGRAGGWEDDRAVSAELRGRAADAGHSSSCQQGDAPWWPAIRTERGALMFGRRGTSSRLRATVCDAASRATALRLLIGPSMKAAERAQLFLVSSAPKFIVFSACGPPCIRFCWCAATSHSQPLARDGTRHRCDCGLQGPWTQTYSGLPAEPLRCVGMAHGVHVFAGRHRDWDAVQSGSTPLRAV